MVKLTPEDRCEILLAIQNNARRNDLALHYGISRQAIYDVERIWKTERRITDKPKAGPKPVYDQNEIQKFVDYSEKHPFATLAEIKSKFSLSYQLPRISTILRKRGLKTCVAKLKNPLTKKAKENRIKFANDYNSLNFDRVVFSDEKTVQNFCNGRVQVRRLRGKGYEEKNMVTMDQNRSCKVNLWGYISKEKCELFKIDNKFKSPAYLKLLQTSFVPEIQQVKTDYIFMQDNASIHKTENVMDFLKAEHIETFDWPARSPDLNPIENIWVEMQKLLNKHFLKKRVTNANQLFTLCKHCFHQVCLKNVATLYESMPRRLVQVIANNGERTRY